MQQTEQQVNSRVTKRFRSFMIEDILSNEQSTLKNLNANSLNKIFMVSNEERTILLNETQSQQQFEQRLDQCLARVRGDLNFNELISESGNSDDNGCEDAEIDVLNTSREEFVLNSPTEIEANASVSSPHMPTDSFVWSGMTIDKRKFAANVFNQNQIATALNLSKTGNEGSELLLQPATTSSTLPPMPAQQPSNHRNCIRHSADSSGSTSFSLDSAEDDDDNVFLQPNCRKPQFNQSIVRTPNSAVNCYQPAEAKPSTNALGPTATAAPPSIDVHAQLIATNAYIQSNF